jgi:hypothetical protein
MPTKRFGCKGGISIALVLIATADHLMKTARRSILPCAAPFLPRGQAGT